MAWTLGIYLTDSFVEVTAAQNADVHSDCWFLPSASLKKGLSAFLADKDISEVDRVNVATTKSLAMLRRRIGKPPAFLVTSGFENWLEMMVPPQSAHFTLQLSRPRVPIDRDLVFGITERVNSQGEVLKPLASEDLDFLISKLELIKTDTIAIGFLNSHKNPEHEMQVEAALSEKGFKVLASYKNPAPHERQRWWSTVLNAYLRPTFAEYIEETRQSIAEALPNEVDINLVTACDESGDLSTNNILESGFGGLSAFYSRIRQETKSPAALYCGLEDFYLIDLKSDMQTKWVSPLGSVALKHPTSTRLKLQPTQILTQGFWGCAGFDEDELGYEPGPMCFGKGVRPTMLDILFVRGRLESVTGFRENLKPTTRSRIHEVLYSYSREAIKSEGLEGAEISRWLEQTAASRWALQMCEYDSSEPVMISGPLATAVYPLLSGVLGAAVKLDKSISSTSQCLVASPGGLT